MECTFLSGDLPCATYMPSWHSPTTAACGDATTARHTSLLVRPVMKAEIAVERPCAYCNRRATEKSMTEWKRKLYCNDASGRGKVFKRLHRLSSSYGRVPRGIRRVTSDLRAPLVDFKLRHGFKQDSKSCGGLDCSLGGIRITAGLQRIFGELRLICVPPMGGFRIAAESKEGFEELRRI